MNTVYTALTALTKQGILVPRGYRYCVRQKDGTRVWRRIDHVMKDPPTSTEYAIDLSAAPMLPPLEEWKIATNHGKKSLTTGRHGCKNVALGTATVIPGDS